MNETESRDREYSDKIGRPVRRRVRERAEQMGIGKFGGEDEDYF